MLNVILFILKLLGWLFLAIAGIFLFVLVTALFVPVYYRLSGEWLDEQKQLLVLIRYLFLRVLVRFDSDEGEEKPTFKCSVRIFGLPLRRRRRAKKEVLLKEDGPAHTISDDSHTDDKRQGTGEKNKPLDEINKPSGEKNKPSGEKNKPSGEKKQLIGERLSAFYSAITNKGNMNAIRLVFHELCRLLRHYGPRRGSADLEFSMGDAANTGLVLGIVSICPLSYKKDVSIHPDFVTDKLYIKGSVSVRGHARLIHLVRCAVRLLLNRDVRNLISRKS